MWSSCFQCILCSHPWSLAAPNSHPGPLPGLTWCSRKRSMAKETCSKSTTQAAGPPPNSVMWGAPLRKAKKQEGLCQSLSGKTASPLGGTALLGSMFNAYLQKGPLSQGTPNSPEALVRRPAPGPCFRASHINYFPSVPSLCGAPFLYAEGSILALFPTHQWTSFVCSRLNSPG